MGLISITYGIAGLGRRCGHADGSGTDSSRRFHEHARGVGSRSLGSFTPSTSQGSRPGRTTLLPIVGTRLSPLRRLPIPVACREKLPTSSRWPSLSLHPGKLWLSAERPSLVGRPSAMSFDSWHEAGATTAYQRGSLTRGRTFYVTTLRRSAAELAANVRVTSSASSAPLDTAVVRAFISATAASITGASGFIGCSTGEAKRARGVQVERPLCIFCSARAFSARAIASEPRRGSSWRRNHCGRLLSNARRRSRRRLFLPAGGCCAVKAPRAAGA
jgi:hypothetical protein